MEKNRVSTLFAMGSAVFKDYLTFPGAYKKEFFNQFVKEFYLERKTINRGNPQLSSTNFRHSYYSFTKRFPLKTLPIKLVTSESDDLVYVGGTVELDKYDQYNCAFKALIVDFSIEMARRHAKKGLAMMHWLRDAFHNKSTKYDNKYLIQYILETKRLLGDMPAGCEYLNKILQKNFILCYNNISIIIDKIHTINSFIFNKINDQKGSGLNFQRYAMPPPRGVSLGLMEHNFEKMLEYSGTKKEIPYQISQKGDNYPVLFSSDLIGASFSDIFHEKSLEVELVGEIPTMEKHFNKEYFFKEENISNFAKYAPNYELDGRKHVFANPIEIIKQKTVYEYDQLAKKYDLGVLAHYQTSLYTGDEGQVINYTSPSSPIFIRLSDFYDTVEQKLTLEAGVYLIKVISDIHYNNLFLLTV